MYFHIAASTIKGNLSALHIETKSLKRAGHGALSPQRGVRRYMTSAILVALVYATGGWKAAGYVCAAAPWGNALIESVNYMEHYGMLRAPAMPVQPYHSWNINKGISSWTMFNLTRHSHHHAQGEVPFHGLKPYTAAPMMISGYLPTIIAMPPAVASADDAQGACLVPGL